MKPTQSFLFTCLLITTVLTFTQCKSVNVNILGFIEKEYGDPAEEVDLSREGSAVGEAPAVEKQIAGPVFSGYVCNHDSLTVEGAHLFVMKEDRFIAYGQSKKDGSFSTQPPGPETATAGQINKRFANAGGMDWLYSHQKSREQQEDSLQPATYYVVVLADDFLAEEKSLTAKDKDTLITSFYLKAQSKLSGTVASHKDQKPIPQAAVISYSKNQRLQVRETDQQGRFQFENLHKDTYIIKVVHEGLLFDTPTVEITHYGTEETVEITAYDENPDH